MKPRTLFEKLWSSHVVQELEGGAALLAIDRIFLHERTGSVALKSLKDAGRTVADPARVFCTMDHIVDTHPGRGDDTRMKGGTAFILETRAAALEAGIRLFDVRDPLQGIVHVISPELGIVLPGATVVCPDSHTCTQGAMGAFAWGIGSTEAEHALATGTLRVNRPKTMRVRFEGKLPRGVTAKDLTLALIARYGSAGGNGYAVEYAGSAVRELDIEARLTLCNMATEFSAMTGFIAPDERTFEYLHGRAYAPQGADWDRALAAWRELSSDADAVFDRDIEIDVGTLAPMITWGTSPQHAVAIDAAVPDQASSGANPEAYARALQYMDVAAGVPLQSLAIGAAFIGSCTNSRIGDLRAAAEVVKGRKVASSVNAMVVPGSAQVKAQAESEGLDQVFRDAGFDWRGAGCSMCLGMNPDTLSPGERCASTSNRNFEGRQGKGGRTHLVSPQMAAAAAIEGHFVDIRTWEG